MVCDVLLKGGVIIYPTDTIYGFGCDIFQHKAVERIANIKGVKLEKSNFSFIVPDLSKLSDYTRPLSSNIFKMMKAHLPGPFTFVLPASNKVPKILENRKKTIGIRIPDNNIIIEIAKTLDHPILTTSIHDTDSIIEYTTDPELIFSNFKDKIDLMVDGGFGGNVPSTIVDCTTDEPFITRQGLGKLKWEI